MADYTSQLLNNNDFYINTAPITIGNHSHTITTNTTSTGTITTPWTDGTEWARPEWARPEWEWMDGGNGTTAVPASSYGIDNDNRFWKTSVSTYLDLGISKEKVLELISLMCILITEHGISPKIIFDIHRELMEGKYIGEIINSLREALNEPEEKDFEKELDNLLG